MTMHERGGRSAIGLRAAMMSQFESPHGPLGALVGWILANRPSNRRRNLWTVELLQLAPHHRVLEIGCGPGLALQACAAKVSKGHVVGVDHSAVMIGQAWARLDGALKKGRVELLLGGLDRLAELAARPFDRIFSVNVVQFLPDKAVAFAGVFAALAPGGVAAATYQPRGDNQSREEALRMAGEIRTAMEQVGFVGVRVEELPLKPAPAVCVLGRRDASAATQIPPYARA